MEQIALVTGANRGLGFEIARRLGAAGCFVWLDCRDAGHGQQAEQQLRALGQEAGFVQLDVTQPCQAAAAAAQIAARHCRLDVLVNNAAVLLDWGARADAAGLELLQRTLLPNVCGLAEVTRALLGLLRRSANARIVNLTSDGGSFEHQDSTGDRFAPAYQVSKAALCMYTLLLAQELAPEGIAVNACSPGWVRTAMGTDAATLSVEAGADTPVRLALQERGGPTGACFAQRQRRAW